MANGFPFRFAFKSEFNSSGEYLALWAMKNDISPYITIAANCLTLDTKWFDRLLMYIRKRGGHGIDPCGAHQKTKQNEN